MANIPTSDKSDVLDPSTPVQESLSHLVAVAAALHRDREEFWAAAVSELRPRLRRYIAKSACDEDEIDDIVADVVGELASREDAFVSCANQWDFVLPILRQCCAERKRRWRNERRLEGELRTPVELSRWEERDERLALAGLWLEAAIMKLPLRQREALRLRYLEDRKYSEISVLMGSSQNAARFNVHAALSRLREMASSKKTRAKSNKTTE